MTESNARIEIVFTPDTKGSGKLADAEIVWHGGPFGGLRLVGFAVWQRRSGAGLNVTFPARQYTVNGDRRSYALLRPSLTSTDQHANDRLRDLIIAAYKEETEMIDTLAQLQAAQAPAPTPAPAAPLLDLTPAPVVVPAPIMAPRATAAAVLALLD